MAVFRYDHGLEPPAPLLPLRVAAPDVDVGAVLWALLDTGADCTIVPRTTPRALGLPAIDEVWIEGVAGVARRRTVYQARVEFAGIHSLAPVVALGDHAILGRDLLNRAFVRLDGPRLTFSLRGPSRSLSSE